ncbi:phosphate acyltransferase PlsX [Xanthobacter autotrophicus]|uniref:phosphate acyltransferase PlsX n=1 Tax=Xanthobacter TaxID=279 RepID=UPI0024AB8AE4|nr:phosphate acyltransferase PlsX [Xanthobacter autotrophicus]MDI4664363.1 phosphate acyltransferase PlsX [Xanthobacter autotrophicus]
MTASVRIALDAMGGDHGPETVLAGAEISLGRHPDIAFVLYGDEARVREVLKNHPRLEAVSRIVHTDVVVGMDDKPSQALRRGRYKSSMWRAIDAVKLKEADVAVSAGNTGALMAMANFNLRTMPGISRPAIAAIWPTLRGESVVLDVGASIGATAKSLVEMAIMGSAMAEVLFDIKAPTVGLLNVGVEEIKGVEEVKEAARILREENVDVNYHGFVEGNDIGAGTVDVVVTEGFSGNIALKTAEGTAKQLAAYLRAAMGRTLRAKIGYLLARDAFRILKEKMDPRRANGGVFLGLNGIVIKSHGGTDAEGFAAAVDLAYDMVRNELLARIEKSLVGRQPPGIAECRPQVAGVEGQS